MLRSDVLRLNLICRLINIKKTLKRVLSFLSALGHAQLTDASRVVEEQLTHLTNVLSELRNH